MESSIDKIKNSEMIPLIETGFLFKRIFSSSLTNRKKNSAAMQYKMDFHLPILSINFIMVKYFKNDQCQ